MKEIYYQFQDVLERKGAFSRKRSMDRYLLLAFHQARWPDTFRRQLYGFHLPCWYGLFCPSISLQKDPTQTAAMAGTPPKWLLPLLTQWAILVGTPRATAALPHLIASPRQDWWPSGVTPVLGKEELAPPLTYLPQSLVVSCTGIQPYPLLHMQQLQPVLSFSCMGTSPTHQCPCNGHAQLVLTDRLRARHTHQVISGSSNPVQQKGTCSPHKQHPWNIWF